MSDYADQPVMTVALVQLNSSDNWQANLEQVDYWVRKASAESKARLLVLPENCLCFGSKGLSELVKQQAQVQQKLAQLAAELNIYLLAGTQPVLNVLDPKQRYFSRSCLYGPKAGIISHYDKIHLFDVDVDDGHGSYRESERYCPGDQVVTAALDEGYCLGMAICYDLRFSGLFQALREQGANLISLPSAFTYVTGQAHWECLIRARAIETQCYMLAANQVGEHSKGRQTWGHSMIVDPWGKVLAQCANEPGFCYASLDLDSLNAVRTKLPMQSHRRSSLY